MSEGYAVNTKSTRDIQLHNLYLQDIAEARSILSKNQSERSRHDLFRLRELLCSKLAYLTVLQQNNKTWILDQLFKNLEYRVYQKDQVVCSIGEKSLEFYLILQGNCSVQIPLPIQNSLKEKKNNDKQNEQETEDDNVQQSPIQTALVEVKILSSGMSFGERGLIENRGRTATIISKEETHILILLKDSFMRILGTYEENKLAQIVNLLHSVEFFRGWSRGSLKWMYYNVLVKKCNLGEYIFSEGQQSDNMYIIIEGDFSVTKSFLIPNELQASNKTSKIYLKKCKNSKYFLSKAVDISLLSKGEVFGEEDLFLQQNRSYSIRCQTQDAIVWVVSKKIFNVKVLGNSFSVHFLERNAKNKIQRFNEIYEQMTQNEQDNLVERKRLLSSERIKLYKECFTQKADIENDNNKFEKVKEAKKIPNSLTSANHYQYSIQNIDMSVDYSNLENDLLSKQEDSQQIDSLPSLSPKKTFNKSTYSLQQRSKSIQKESQFLPTSPSQGLHQTLLQRNYSPSKHLLNLSFDQKNIDSPRVELNKTFTCSQYNKTNTSSIFPAIQQHSSKNQGILSEENIKNNTTIEQKHKASKKKFYKESDNTLIEKIINNDAEINKRNNREVVQLNKIFNQLQYDKDVFQLQKQQRQSIDINNQEQLDILNFNIILKGDYTSREIKFNSTEMKKDLREAIVIDQVKRSRSQQKSYATTNPRTPHMVSFSKNGRKNQFDNKYIFTLI